MSSRVENSRFRIWQISDTHLYADPCREMYGMNCDASLRQVLSVARSLSEPADLCLLTGDLVHDGSETGYQRLLNYIDGLGVPVYCLPGNHDDVELMRRMLKSERVSCDKHILFRQWLIVLLDTTVTGSEAGHLSEHECRRLELLIQQYNDRHILLALHHPPVSTSMAWMDSDVTLDNPERVHQLVKKYSRIRAVIWGHAHQEYSRIEDGVLWAGCPSTMAQFKPDSVDFTLDSLLPGLRVLDLGDDGGVESSVIRGS